MRTVRIGDFEASAIGLGGWQFGGKEWGWDSTHRAEDHQIIHRAIELGVNFIDTAEGYSKGESEAIIGEALEGHRDKVFIATKLMPIMPTPARIVRAAEASRQRLRVDKIDLYQIHWPNPVIPIGTQMKGMQQVRDRGIAEHLGVSNFGLAAWQKAERALGGPVISNQVQYNLLRRGAEKTLPWAQANKRVVIAYSPLAQGMLTGKYSADNAPGGCRKMNAAFTRAGIEAAQPLIAALREIAKVHDATPAQIALAWVIHHPGVIAIPGARNVAQLEQNVAAGQIQLSEEDFERLNALSAAAGKSGLKAVPQFVGRMFTRRPAAVATA
ncbi:MAG TPA: aldo/keto reductase [Phycisphaerae bacterium]|nr:aldo/keto reductase [Phycisphaerales bacterium]HRX84978.1 aldo/keto reductase [Phycisphaerae bacterium]